MTSTGVLTPNDVYVTSNGSSCGTHAPHQIPHMIRNLKLHTYDFEGDLLTNNNLSGWNGAVQLDTCAPGVVEHSSSPFLSYRNVGILETAHNILQFVIVKVPQKTPCTSKRFDD